MVVRPEPVSAVVWLRSRAEAVSKEWEKAPEADRAKRQEEMDVYTRLSIHVNSEAQLSQAQQELIDDYVTALAKRTCTQQDIDTALDNFAKYLMLTQFINTCRG